MQGSIESDIAILGAGPAGLTAALVLGRKGIPCILIDAGSFPKEKVCGDGLSGKVISLLNKIDPGYAHELGAKPFVTPSRAVRFFSPGLKMVEVGFDSADHGLAPGFICRRMDFDNFLLEKALEWPAVRFLPETFIDKVEVSDHSILLCSRDGTINIRTRLVLVATGSERKIVESLIPGYPGISEEGLGVRAYFGNVTGSDEKHSIEIHFLKELLPWYLWIFPFKDGSANVGLALPMSLVKKRRLSLKELLFKLIDDYPSLKSRFSGSDLHVKVEAARIPYFTGRQQLSGDNFMLMGDAAHLIDPFTGEGISHAMISGYIAAETAEMCIKQRKFGRDLTGSYQNRIYEKLGPELELGLRLQGLAHNQRLLNLVIGRASKNEKVRKLLEEMLFSINTKGKLSQPLFYLKLMLGI